MEDRLVDKRVVVVFNCWLSGHYYRRLSGATAKRVRQLSLHAYCKYVNPKYRAHIGLLKLMERFDV